MAQRWSLKDVPDLTGLRAVVTGASSGLGEATARALTSRGAAVVLAVRDESRGSQAQQRILKSSRGADVSVRRLDLASLTSVRTFAASTVADGPLDLLVNNAGVMATPLRFTEDGFELQFGTNHLGHFALTGLLLPALLGREGSRVVTVSSLAHRGGHLAFDNLDAEHSYAPGAAYGQAKLANLVFALELQRRLAAAGAGTISVAAHPGLAGTNLFATSARMRRMPLAQPLNRLAGLFMQSAVAGAEPIVYASTMPDVRGGEYFGPSRWGETRGAPIRAAVAAQARSTSDAAQLWAESETRTGVTYELGASASS